MIDIVIGIAIGAAFSPFWMFVWHFCRTQLFGLANHTKTIGEVKADAVIETAQFIAQSKPPVSPAK